MYGSIGKLGVTGISCATNQAIAFLKCDPNIVDTWYAFYLLLSQRRYFVNAGRGGTQSNISQEFLKSYEIELPDLGEQRRITAALGQVEHVRPLKKYGRDLTASFLSAKFLELFGDPSTNPRGWEKCLIGDVVSSSQYGLSRRSHTANQGYPILGMGNVTYDGRVDLSNVNYS